VDLHLCTAIGDAHDDALDGGADETGEDRGFDEIAARALAAPSRCRPFAITSGRSASASRAQSAGARSSHAARTISLPNRSTSLRSGAVTWA
jgi:hypothetical protein